MVTNHLGRNLPKEYLDFIANYKKQDFWLTMYPNTENQFSEEVEIWTESQLFSRTYDKNNADYQWLSASELDFSLIDFREDVCHITPEEVESGFVIGSLNAGFIFLNLHDGSVWLWYDDMFCEKQADSFTEFQKLLTSEPIDDDFEDEE
ncbi:hypothetical protein [Capnocytophaga stomatis]|uniref:SMI1/KNR4 family protein n=2 Tax=Capnocytophaga stomatis TaxID=1848904 RepID=A0ABW8QB14_9FLAO|nr:hypothetical protein [Capnocytophaga stomatis]GIJ96773.1 hypothetical protein CAPN001_13420 [Capnocytophaga stomatis]